MVELRGRDHSACPCPSIDSLRAEGKGLACVNAVSPVLQFVWVISHLVQASRGQLCISSAAFLDARLPCVAALTCRRRDDRYSAMLSDLDNEQLVSSSLTPKPIPCSAVCCLTDCIPPAVVHLRLSPIPVQNWFAPLHPLILDVQAHASVWCTTSGTCQGWQRDWRG